VSFATEALCKEVEDPPNAKSVVLFQRGCDGGDVLGCEKVSVAFMCGLGVERDLGKSGEAAERACKLGSTMSCGNAGAAFMQIGDEARALVSIKRGCDAGDLGSCNNLGSYYLTKGDDDNLHRAAELFGKLCDRANEMSCANLGQLYFLGAGVPKDLKRARDLGERACKAKIGIGCNVLASALNELGGEGEKAAAQTFIQGCELGASAACDNAAQCYLYGRGGVALDKAQAERLFRRGCDMGWAHACSQLGMLTH
jgi:TPR repeat protein